MRAVYRVVAWILAAEVVVQAAAIAYAVFGLARWIEQGGVADKAAVESGTLDFPGVVGFMVHGLNGTAVVPLLALALLVASFLARVPRGVALAGAAVGLVALQILLGVLGHGVPFLGLLHGANALLLFTVAVVAARTAGAPAPVSPAGAAPRAAAAS